MGWKTHYFNPKSQRLACNTPINAITMGHEYTSARIWTEDKDEVNCKKCLIQLEKWRIIEYNREKRRHII